MNFMSNFMGGGSRGTGGGMGGFNPRQDLIQSSQRGGLPQILDMLKAYPAYFFERTDIEEGNKILLPVRILQEITDRFDGNMPSPMIFSLSSLKSKNTVYVGVLEFEAPDNTCVLPFWLFSEMKLTEGETLRLGLVNYLAKASFVKIRPHKTEFVMLPDPRSILEIHLRNFVCLTLNQTICIRFMGKEYYMDILELQPKTQYNAVVLVDTDLNLEFAAPLDYVEPVRQPKAPEPVKGQTDAQIPAKAEGPFAGAGTRLDGRQIKAATVPEPDNDYDPRKFKIPRGIRKEWNQSFQGQGMSIGSQGRR